MGNTEPDKELAPGDGSSEAALTDPLATDPSSERPNDAPRSEERTRDDKASVGLSRERTSASAPREAYEAVARSARLPDLVAITQAIVGEAVANRTADMRFASKVRALADEADLPHAEADTPFGNALKVLGAGPEGKAERALASALWAHAIAESRRDDDDRLARDVLWLATHTAFDATPLLERALGDDADDLLTAIAGRVRAIVDGRGASLGRGEAIVGVATLASATSPHARALSGALEGELEDPVLRSLVAQAGALSAETSLDGESRRPARSPLVTTLLALTGLLFVQHAARILAKLALAYATPSTITVSREGVHASTRVRILGRTLRERDEFIPTANLARALREVRYPGAMFYAGLLALAVGSLVGVRTFIDGVRAASPSLLGAGLSIVALGIAADFVLGSLLPGSQGRCRVTFTPRSGRTICVGDVDTTRADAAMKALERRS